MRTRTRGWAWVLGLVLAVAPAVAQAQNINDLAGGNGQSDGTVVGNPAGSYGLPDPNLPIPLQSTHPELGGFYLSAEYLMYRMTNTMGFQQVAIRGFQIVDTSVSPYPAGAFVGSGTPALNTNQVSGPNGFTPGFDITAGWKFRDGSSIAFDFFYLTEFNTTATATLAPRHLAIGPNQADSFLTAPVFNFDPSYAGPPNKVSQGDAFATYGIWDGASVMWERFIRRFQQMSLTYRVPVYENEYFRTSGTCGPRFAWFYDKYQWRTTDLESTGTINPNDVGIYQNQLSNRLYGAFVGCQNEWYLGCGLACQLGLEAAGFVDGVRITSLYQFDRGFNGPERKRSYKELSFVPEVRGNLGLMWYPTQSIQCYLGYDVMLFFNTSAAPQPIDFNMSSVTPQIQTRTRVLDGLRVGIGFIF